MGVCRHRRQPNAASIAVEAELECNRVKRRPRILRTQVGTLPASHDHPRYRQLAKDSYASSPRDAHLRSKTHDRERTARDRPRAERRASFG